MKKRLVILSDLWGDVNNEWLHYYINTLAQKFDIEYYNCYVLAEVNTIDFKKEELHKQFVNHGITTAVEKLIALELDELDVLAFSIGGTIAWKAALKGLKVKSIFAVSATRLRYELNKPTCEINLIYGEQDPFKPSIEWLEKMNLSYEVLKNVGHDLYSQKRFSVDICDEIMRKYL